MRDFFVTIVVCESHNGYGPCAYDHSMGAHIIYVMDPNPNSLKT